MIRKGRFALWNDREFELVSYQREYYLRSMDPFDIQLGFQAMKRNECVFIKSISIRELEDAYEIIPYVMISGYRFAVAGRNEKTGNIALVTNNPFVQEKVAVRSYGKFEYIIELPLEEIKIEEDRVPILGFEGSYP